MKYINSVLGLLVAVALFATACTSGSTDVAESTTPTAVEAPTEVPTEAPDEPTPTEVPTEVPLPEVTDQDRIDAVIAAMDAAIEDGTAPNGSIAYDLLDTSVSDESGNVTLGICEWTGDTVYDTVRDSLWRTSVADDGTIATEHVTTSVAQGDCTNTHMIETALAASSGFDAFRREIAADPALWAGDPRQELIDAGYREFTEGEMEGYLNDGVHFPNWRFDGDLLDTRLNEILWRAVPDEPGDLLQFVFCRPMNPDYGLYRDGVLFDNGRTAQSSGLNSIDAYQLLPAPGFESGWQVAGFSARAWSECPESEGWPEIANDWLPSANSFVILDR